MSSPQYKVYLFEYFHEGSWWTMKVHATSMDDAQARMNKMPLAKQLGEMYAEYPARLGWFAKLSCAVRNFFGAQPAV